MVLRKENAAAKGFLLAIETGILGGSLAVLKDGKFIGGWTGSRQVSRAEDVLEEISRILVDRDISKKSIQAIAISKGPGSYTGLRIGAAIALGLKKSLNCAITSQTILESMRFGYAPREKIVCAVPFGKNQICWQYFSETLEKTVNTASADIRISQSEQFGADCSGIDFKKLILHESLYVKFNSLRTSAEISKTVQNKDSRFFEKDWVCADKNPARLIGLSAGGHERFAARFKPDLVYPHAH